MFLPGVQTVSSLLDQCWQIHVWNCGGFGSWGLLAWGRGRLCGLGLGARGRGQDSLWPSFRLKCWIQPRIWGRPAWGSGRQCGAGWLAAERTAGAIHWRTHWGFMTGIFHWEEFEGRLLGVGDKEGVSNISLTTWPSWSDVASEIKKMNNQYISCDTLLKGPSY